MDEHVAPGLSARDVHVLPLELGDVVVAVPGRDSLADLEQAGLVPPALFSPDGFLGLAFDAGVRSGVVAVAEAEAGLAVGTDQPPAGCPPELVALEAEQVPVRVGLGAHVTHPVASRADTRRAVFPADGLANRHRRRRAIGPAPLDEKRAPPDVVHRGGEREPVGVAEPDDGDRRRNGLVEVGEELRGVAVIEQREPYGREDEAEARGGEEEEPAHELPA